MKIINLTSFLKLGKPTRDEMYDIHIINNNMDIIDEKIKGLQNNEDMFATQESVNAHIRNKKNPHNITKEEIGLDKVVNKKQMYGISTPVTYEGIPVFDGNGYTLKDSAMTIKTSVPENARFTDTIYTHPISHPAAMIVEDDEHRFVTKEEKEKIVDMHLTNNLLAQKSGSALDALQGAILDEKITSNTKDIISISSRLETTLGALETDAKFEGSVNYCIKNGICFVTMSITSKETNNENICIGLPSPLLSEVYLSLNAHTRDGSSVNYSAIINRNGTLSIEYPVYIDARINCTFSYPVAE